MPRPTILITNDDGIKAPGIRYLWNSLREYADLYVVAPATEQSGKSISITCSSALHIACSSDEWDHTPVWNVSGTPADCVKIALSVLLPRPPNLIVSGINHGSNAGRGVLYSGTVGGVIEGILRGIPGIAFSSYDFDQTEFALFTPYIPTIVEYALSYPIPKGTLLNVNFPSTQGLQKVPQGIKLTRQGSQYWLEDPFMENGAYSLGAKLQYFDEHEESDIYWLEKGYITSVPVHVNELTDWEYLRGQKEHFEAFTASKHPLSSAF